MIRAFLFYLSVLALALGCAAPPPEDAPPLLLVGIDGGEWQVIEGLWREGRLPVLRSLADRGVRATLGTDYAASPVIWTTIATGRLPRDHGITDFVVPTPRGDVPVTSDLRRVPALWNMASTAGRRVAVLGWWASWPAEPITGVMVTDRVLLNLDRAFHPPERQDWLDQHIAAAAADPVVPTAFDARGDVVRRDRLKGRLAADLVRQPFDLWMVYFRNADVVSHTEWKYFDPEPFGDGVRDGLTAQERSARAAAVPESYEAIDRALGEILAALPPAANVLVVSDHGFKPETKEIAQVIFDLDAVLERLGYLARDASGAVDFRRTQVYSYRSPKHKKGKTVRFSLAGREAGGAVLPRERTALRERLARDLARVTYDGGEPIFWLRDVRPPEARLGADFVIGVTNDAPSRTLWLDGEPFEGPVEGITRITGTHDANTEGIFLAAGPDIDPRAQLTGINIHDLAGTVLFGTGLPVGEDFAGTVRQELFRESFRQRFPLRTVTSWGRRDVSGRATSSEADAELLEELGALGYLN
ncbi:MAG: alkaline phosphatase family protein [Acidobacteriota bacterium]